jgi:hypothetical protein
MKTSSEKSSTTPAKHAASNQPFFAPARAAGFFAAVSAAPAVQFKMAVNNPGDKFEQEADRMADKVLRMPAPPTPGKEEKLQRQPGAQSRKDEQIQKAALPEEKLQKAPQVEEKVQKASLPEGKIQTAAMPADKLQKNEGDQADDDKLQKAPAADEKLQRKGGDATPAVGDSVQSAIRQQSTGGQPLASDVRAFMEPRFGADFSTVRVHHDAESASLNNQLSARAFTYQNHVFFSRDQYQPGSSDGKQLLAHELTHTVQQGHAVQRAPVVSTTTTPPPVQRLGLSDALDYFADKAYLIPGFRLLTLLLGFNPINRRSADRNAANLLRALIELIPGGIFITQALDEHGVINKAAAWVEQKLALLGNIGGEIVGGLKRFMDSLSWRDIFDLGGVWERAKRIFTEPIGRLIAFGGSVVVEILKMVKDAILKPLAALAQGTRGYDLLKAILGEDPITGEAVPRTADTLIGGFMKLIGQEEIWENIKKGNAIARAWAWFQGALNGLMGFVRSVPRRIVMTLSSLTFKDIITVAGAFGKLVGAFVSIAADFISWGLQQVISLLEILFSVVAPSVVPYLKKARGAFTTIIRDPIAFVGNLVRAGRQGFQMFASHIGMHLKAALIKWIVGPLGDAGVYIPQSFSLIEIIKLVLSVLGLTWQAIRSKLVKIIPDPVLAGLEKTAAILVTLVKEGPVAAWEQIKSELSELKEQLIAKVTEMISSEVVKAAVTKLVSMLNPAGAVVQAIIAIYNTITFFIEKIQQIGAVVASFIDSIAAIAAGQVGPAAKKVEQTMANTLTVIIAFLAKFAGLGNIPDKIVGIIKKIRQPIDKGLDKIVGFLGNMLKKMGSAVKGAAGSIFQWWKKKLSINAGSEKHSLYFQGDEDSAEPIVASSPKRLDDFVSAARANPEIIGNPTKKVSLDAIAGEIDNLRKIRSDLRRLRSAAEDKRKPYIDNLDKSTAKIGAGLEVVLAGSKSGTKDTPIPIPWPKPAYNNYPTIFLFNQGEKNKPKWKLSAKRATGTRVAASYAPDGKHSIGSGPPAPPTELRGLGIKDPYQLTDGKVVGPLSEASTPGGDKINSLLGRYGWDASSEYMDGDHVLEIQFGGKDVRENLWPLDASINRGAGSRLAKQQVDLDGQKITIDWLKKAKTKPGDKTSKYFFRIAVQ